MKLTRAQAHRLIELYGYTGARDRLELDTDASGEPVSWVAQDQIDRIIYR